MKLSLDIAESLKIAWNAISANKSRGGLTALGIIIGIVAVITTMTAANGLKNTFKQTFASVGADTLYVSRRPWVQMGPDFSLRNRPEITFAVSDALTRKLQGRAIVNPSMGGSQPMKYQNNQLDDIGVSGTTDKLVLVSNQAPARGRFLLPYDVQYKRRTASTWRLFRTDTAKATGTFNPSRDGRYVVRARTSNLTGSRESTWSPTRTLAID